MLNTPVIPSCLFFTGCNDLTLGRSFPLPGKLYKCIYSGSLVVLFFPSLLYSLFSFLCSVQIGFIGVHAYR